MTSLTSGFLPEGDRGDPLRQFTPLRDFAPPPEIWSENNRKISITKEICITIDFAPLEKIPGRKPDLAHNWGRERLKVEGTV